MAIDLDTRYRTLLILWVALLMSVVTLFVMTMVVAPPTDPDRGVSPSFVLLVMAGVGTLLVVLSFAVKRKLLQRSVEKQDVTLVQQALVVGCAMCEVNALLGVVERLVIGSGAHYVLFLVSAIGLALHFPKRDHLLAAAWNDETRRQV